ncbi:hypothetical protein SO802_018881 [Lithocarpus litseifolius]|uniref:Prolamin-like domain-containing protein n=1 Tax=Lithocarpus litseifolius TaxID=425828 RepID=A0AAW2CMN2_9ROSI
MAMNNVFILLVLSCLLANATGTRDLPIKPEYEFTNIGPGCCSSISSISKNCWPSTLASFGLTTKVHNKLQDHCEAVSGPAPAPIAGSDAPLAN